MFPVGREIQAVWFTTRSKSARRLYPPYPSRKHKTGKRGGKIFYKEAHFIRHAIARKWLVELGIIVRV
jgi:hypothetical protein